MSEITTYVKCNRCGIFIPYEDKEWVMKKGKPVCIICAEYEREKNDERREETRTDNVG
jgi:formylmethanofuran dehydrogenase subunit E